MKKQDSKQRLFEVMGRLDKSFKLNESWYDGNSEDDEHEDHYEDKTNEFGNLYYEYIEYAEYFNNEKSKIEGDGEGSSEITYVFDIPKSIYSDSMFDDIEGSSHGVEGNAGGMVSRTSVSDPVDMGDYVEIIVTERHILDV